MNGPVEAKRVIAVFSRLGRILHVHVGGQVIRTTPEHPFYVYSKGWQSAGGLQPRDWLSSHDGEWVQIEEVYDTGEHETVYNLCVEDWHTYFVGAWSWGWSAWAHNADAAGCGGKTAVNDRDEEVKLRNGDLAGKAHPETSVPFNRNGFPVFDSAYDTRIPAALYHESDYKQFKAATENLSKAIKRNPSLAKQFNATQLEQINSGETPDGFTWHHHQSPGKMQLVDAQIHHDTGHTGGRELWGGGGENR